MTIVAGMALLTLGFVLGLAMPRGGETATADRVSAQWLKEDLYSRGLH